MKQDILSEPMFCVVCETWFRETLAHWNGRLLVWKRGKPRTACCSGVCSKKRKAARDLTYKRARTVKNRESEYE